MNSIPGTSGDDTLTGSDAADLIQGLSGRDSLTGEAGADTLLGGEGSDTLVGGAGNDVLDGGEVKDRVNFADLNVVSYRDAPAGVVVNLGTGRAQDGQGGTDTLIHMNVVLGSDGDDVILGGKDPFMFEMFEGFAGNDTLSGGVIGAASFKRVSYAASPSGVVVDLQAGTAQDGWGYTDTLVNIQQVRGSGHADQLLGSNTTAYTEFFEGRAGNDTLDGCGGLDVLRYDTSPNAVYVNLATGEAQDGFGSVDTFTHMEGIRGSAFNDVLTGGNPANGSGALDGFEFFEGIGGNDTIDGGVGYDRVDYERSPTGVSVTLGGAADGTAQDGFGGTDTLRNIEAVRGSSLNDTLTGSDSAAFESFEGMAGNDTLDGRGGTDRVDYRFSPGAVTVNLAAGTATDGHGSLDMLANIEGVWGSAFNDVLTGGNPANGSGALDGFEFFEGMAGNDTIDGGAGYDRVDFERSPTGVSVTLGGAADGTAQDGWGGTDTLRNIESVRGSSSSDTLTGSDSAAFESFEGMAGNDTLDGRGGTDRVDYRSSTGAVTVNLAAGTATDGHGGVDMLANMEDVRGSAHNDTLVGDAAGNKLEGLAGNDTLIGGAGADVFVFAGTGNGTDTIMDWGTGDRIRIERAAFTAAATVGDGSAVGKNAVQLQTVAGLSTLSIGTDDAAGADVIIRLNGSFNLTHLRLSGQEIVFNGAPTASNRTLTATEDVARALTVADFGFSDVDAGNTLQSVTITRLSNAGSLKLNGTSITLNQVISATDISTGKLIFTPAANANGTAYANWGFKVSDGTALSASAYTMTVNVTAVRDDLTKTGTAGNDTLIGDTIDAGSYDRLSGLAGNDNLSGLAGNDTLDGGAGNDTLNGGTGADSMTGGDGSDTYYVDSTSDKVVETNATASTGGTDLVLSYLGAYTLGTNVENGRIMASGTASMTGNSLNNLLYAGAGNNVINGGTGTDTLSYLYATAAITLDLSKTTAQATGGSGSDTVSGIENLTGSKYNDKLTGSSGANRLDGGSGNDTLSGGSGNDTLIGGTGNDTLNGGTGADSMTGGDGSDTYYVDSTSDKVVETNATASTGGTDLVLSYLGAYTLGSNVENGRIMASGTASMTGNSLNNLLYAGAGNNVLNGSTGTDTLSYVYATAAVTLNLSKTTAQATGGSGSDTVSGIENLTGSKYNDKLTGSSGANRLDGGSGNDTLSGGSGNDTLIGGTGNDTLIGGAGKDSLTGGTGNDIFDFNALSELGLGSAARDVITDFTVGQDKMDLSTIDARSTVTGDQAFTFVTAFTATAGQVRYSGGVVYLNTDTDTAAEFEIQLTGTVPTSLTAASFVL